MATPTTRETLKEYALRALGQPVIEINVDNDQLEDRLDEAMQYYAQFHMNADNEDGMIDHIDSAIINGIEKSGRRVYFIVASDTKYD